MPGQPDPRELAALPDAALRDAVQRQTLRYFWEGAHPASGLARDRCGLGADPDDELVTTGGSGFGILALIVAAERGWLARDAVLGRLEAMLAILVRAPRYHGVFPHFMDGRDGTVIAMFEMDDGGDLVETATLFMGLLSARQYFDRQMPREARLRATITSLWEEVEWDWYTQGGRDVLYWHWSPNHGWGLDRDIRGWNECLLTYVLAAASPRHAIEPRVYHLGFAGGRFFRNGTSRYGVELPLGPPGGGPLFFCHAPFSGLDPRGLRDLYADYWQQCVGHVQVNHAYCIDNPGRHRGYGESCWGLTACDGPDGYAVHAPDTDDGTIAPTAALSSMPYATDASMLALRHFLAAHGDRAWGRYGFIDAFCEDRDWYADSFLAIDQGPVITMLENHRSALLWRLFMSVPDVQAGLRRLEFASPWLAAAAAPGGER